MGIGNPNPKFLTREDRIRKLIEWFRKDCAFHHSLHVDIAATSFKVRLTSMSNMELEFEYELWDESNAAAGIF